MGDRTCLVTGASGFLGRRIAERLDGTYTVVRQGFTSTGKDLIRADLRNPEEVARLVRGIDPALIVHCAAYRDPDWCEAHPDETRALNVQPVRMFCDAISRDVRFLCISTDYVFDGENPPYAEEKVRLPVNTYGRSKQEAEDFVLWRGNGIVLRLPLLVGAGADWATSGMLYKTVKLIRDGETAELDDVGIRFPTWIDDVAEAVALLLQRQEEGIFHCSGPTPTTRYGVAELLAGLLGESMDHISPSKDTPAAAKRPPNSQLSCEKLKALGFDRFTPLEEVARTVLSGFNLL